MRVFESIVMFIGRVAISLIFLLAAYQKITHWDATVHEMVLRHIPETSIALFLTCILEFFGGLSLILGFKVRWSAAILALFLIPTTILFHDFWNYSGKEYESMLIMFLKNLAIFGGLLTVAANDPGSVALDSR